MVDVLKALRNVALDVLFSPGPRLLHGLQCRMTAAARSEAVGVVAKLRLVVRLQEGAYYFLQPACRTTRGSSQHTTPWSQPSSESVTITHPYHPLRGQRVTLVRVRQGADPDLIVRLPDGTHTALAMSSTDYAGAPADTPPQHPAPLLTLDGLRQVVRLVACCRQRVRVPTPPDASRPLHHGASLSDEGN